MIKGLFSASVAALALASGVSAQLSNSTIASANGTFSNITSSSAATPLSNVTLMFTSIRISTSSSATATSAAATSASDPVFCPALAGKAYVGPQNVDYQISCDQTFGGTLLTGISKRQTQQTLQSCLATCSAVQACVATAFDTNHPTCYFFSSINGTSSAVGFETAIVSSRANQITTSSNSTTATTAPLRTGSSTVSSGNITTFSFSLASTRTSSSAVAHASDPVFCPSLSGQIYLGPLGVSYRIGCDQSYLGVAIGITLSKRAPTSLSDCLQVCSQYASCVATSFNTNSPTCYFYSNVTSQIPAVGFEAATVVSRGANSTSSASTSPTSSSATSSSLTSSSPSTSATAAALNDIFCPHLDDDVFIDTQDVSYLIQCGTNHDGVVINVFSAISKRQATAAPSLEVCINACDAATGCVATAFDTVAQTCTLFSSIGVSYYDPTIEFALIVAPATIATPGATVTSTVFSTGVVTISSCAPTVTNCPLASGVSVVTTVVPVSTTEYICPTITTIAATPVACTNCPYSSATVTAYSPSVVTIYSCAATVTNCPLSSSAGGSSAYTTSIYTVYSCGSTVTNCPLTSGASSVVVTSVVAVSSAPPSAVVTTFVPVATTVINYPLPASSGAAATASNGAAVTASNGAAVTASNGAAATASPSLVTVSGTSASSGTSGLVAFTGAAQQLEAKFGMAGAVVAGALLLF